MENSFKVNLEFLSNKINVMLNDKQISKYYQYMNLLLEWNEKINLTSITKQDEIILKHFIDSMTILKYLDKYNKIIDVGTGAGFPGIPIAIMKEEKSVTLMDSLNKRIKFLEDIKQKLDLKNIDLIHSRAEDLGQDLNNREMYDVSVSRAVANLTTLVEYLIPFIKIGGICICMKGQDVEEEINDSKRAIELLGGRIKKVDEFYLPDSDMKRNIVIIEKIRSTNKIYPRKAGLPSKEPLK